VLLPGVVLPAERAYAALLDVLGDHVEAIVKELEVYSGDRPPEGFSLAVEVDGILREADARGFDRFHLVGYSAGGASSLALATVHGERLLSLALLEPAWAGNERTREEDALMERFRALEARPDDEFMAGFVRLQLAPGVEPPSPPDGPPPPWMATRPAGARAFLEAFDKGDLDLEALRAFAQPVYFALGGAATRTTTAGWRRGWLWSSPTSPSRRSRSATTSTRHTGSSPGASPARCSHSGSGPNLAPVSSDDPHEYRTPTKHDLAGAQRRVKAGEHPSRRMAPGQSRYSVFDPGFFSPRQTPPGLRSLAWGGAPRPASGTDSDRSVRRSTSRALPERGDLQTSP
jgi:pimeloyl-ACP methyl ester carboxylesterase